MNGAGRKPRIELMLMIWPAPSRRMPGSTARTMRRTPMTLVSNSACAWLMLVSSTAPTRLTPALLISTSIRPARLHTASTQALADASSRTSSGTSSTPASGRVVAGARTPPKARWPRVAISSAVARPMPDDAPVIRATRLVPSVIRTPHTCRQSRSAQDDQGHLLAVRSSPQRPRAMPHSPKHKRDTREKILESARRLFNRKGYAGVSIEEIMSDAGLTHGGFYRHFSSKDELYAAAVRQFLCKKAPAAWQKRRTPSPVTKHRAQRIVDAYFSREHFDDHEGCCPLLGTAADVERSGEAVKAAYQEVVEQLVKVFEDHLNEPREHERALALVALCVGGMVLARNVGDSSLADA